jgi:hypothetical protein
MGPEFRLNLGRHRGLAIKYQDDTWVRNRPRGSALWFQLCLPIPWVASR